MAGEHLGGQWEANQKPRHYCVVPKVYPNHLVWEGSKWTCKTCVRQWEAFGIQRVAHPEHGGQNQILFGPEQWRLVNPDLVRFPGEEGLYDFRPEATILAEQLREVNNWLACTYNVAMGIQTNTKQGESY